MTKAEIKKKLATLGYTGTNAIAEFQRDNGLVADGVAGKKTIKKIRERLGNR
jgi:putative peptidoglycan binding domain